MTNKFVTVGDDFALPPVVQAVLDARTDARLGAARIALVVQVGGAYPAPLPTGYAGIEFRGSVDPATQFTLTGNYLHRWVRTP